MDLSTTEIVVLGRVPGASNAVYMAETLDGTRCVYKPAAGERPLWDFPGMILAKHEVAAYEVSRAMGFDVVPTTVWREDLPQGPGALQLWVPHAETPDVSIFPADTIPTGWLPVMSGEDDTGDRVVVAHRDSARLSDVALLDVVINNSDRKAGHLLGAGADIMGIDHGVAFHPEWKLRTVLWGFADRSLGDHHTRALHQLLDTLDRGLALTGVDYTGRAALVDRATDLLRHSVFPLPRPGWPVVPWPLW
jgi:uncharacterized repeat protein (TIGR03843 family)